MPNQPTSSAKNVTGDFDKFTEFMRRLVAGPHSEIKDKLDAERTSKTACRDAGASSRKRASQQKRYQACVSPTLPGQVCIGEALPLDLRHCQHKPIRIIQRIIFRGAVVVPEDLLRPIAVQVEGFHGNIGSPQTAPSQAPDVLDALSVNLTC